VQKILKTHILHSLPKTWAIINDIVQAHALTTDTGLTPGRIVQIARSVSGISRKNINFIRVPVVTYPNNNNWVEYDPSQAPKLFNAIERDRALPKTPSVSKGKGSNGSTGKKSKKGPPPKLLSASSVDVNVLNGSGVQGIAGNTAIALGDRGFHILSTA